MQKINSLKDIQNRRLEIETEMLAIEERLFKNTNILLQTKDIICNKGYTQKETDLYPAVQAITSVANNIGNLIDIGRKFVDILTIVAKKKSN